MQIKDLKPSDIIQAMIKGLKKMSKRKTFKVTMNTFGDRMLNTAGKSICCGCAATCAIQEMYNFKFNVKTIGNRYTRSTAINLDYPHLLIFEDAVNFLRMGRITDFYNYIELLGIKTPENCYEKELPHLCDNSYMSDLKYYKEFANYLKKIGY